MATWTRLHDNLLLEHLPPWRTLEFPIVWLVLLPKYGDIRDKFLCCLDCLERWNLFYIWYSPILTDASDVNLTELQKTLDAQGIELVDNQKESVIGRKALAEKTKGLHPTLISLFHSTQYFPVLEFKKIADEEKLNAFKGLLKGMRQVHDTYMTHSHFGAQPTRRRLTASRSAQRHQTMHSYMSTKSWQKPPTHTLSLRLQWSVPPSYFIQNRTYLTSPYLGPGCQSHRSHGTWSRVTTTPRRKRGPEETYQRLFCCWER